MAVSAAFFLVHWVGFEDGVEHVGGVDLGAVDGISIVNLKMRDERGGVDWWVERTLDSRNIRHRSLQ